MKGVRLGYTFAPIPEWIVFHPTLTPLAIRVYAVLARRGMTPENCYPSHEWIAARCHVSQRSVARPLAELEMAGAIRSIHRGSHSGGRTSDGYWLAGDAPLTAQDSAVTNGVSAQDSAVRTALESAPNENQLIENQKTPAPNGANGSMNGHAKVNVSAQNRRIDALFEDWWKIYPKKADKPVARRAFRSALKLGATVEVLTAGARAYRDDPKRKPDFTKNASTWLRAESWENELEPSHVYRISESGRLCE